MLAQLGSPSLAWKGGGTMATKTKVEEMVKVKDKLLGIRRSNAMSKRNQRPPGRQECREEDHQGKDLRARPKSIPSFSIGPNGQNMFSTSRMVTTKYFRR